jgi:diguanylate cyclase (GGDEF)-like protein
MLDSTPSTYVEIDALIQEAQAALHKDQGATLRLCDEIERLSEASGYRRGMGKAWLFRALAWYGTGRVGEAIELAGRLTVAAREAGDRWLEGEALATLGVYHQQMGNYEASFECKLRAVSLCRETGDVQTLSRTLNNLGCDYGHLGDRETSYRYHLEALEASRAVGERFGEAFSLHNLSLFYSANGDMESYEEYVARALDIVAEFRFTVLEADVRRNRAKMYLDRGDLGAARGECEAALALARTAGSTAIACRSLIRLGDIRAAAGEYANALTEYQRATEEARRTRFPRGEVEALRSMADTHTRFGDLARARECLDRAVEMLEPLPFPEERINLQEARARLAEAEGDFRTALAHTREYHRLKEEAVGQTAHRRIAAVTTKLKVEQAEREAEAERARAEELTRAQEDLNRLLAEKSVLLVRLEEHRRELERLATRDELTGLYNRRYFEQEARVAYDRARRAGGGLTVVIADIDNFKAINDRYGHPVGDEVLKRVAAELRDGIRAGDLVARYGGEEFALLVPEADAALTVSLMTRLTRRVAALRWAEIGPNFRVTISVGVCDTLTLPGADRMMSQADIALYHAKTTGKNRVSVAPVRPSPDVELEKMAVATAVR